MIEIQLNEKVAYEVDNNSSKHLVQDFFKKHGVAVMAIRELFDFIVDPSINDESVDGYLEEV